MIRVSAAAMSALRERGVNVRPRVRWRHRYDENTKAWGDEIEVTDRMVGWPSVSRRIGAFLSGATESKVVLTLQNGDRHFAPGNGWFANRDTQDRLMAQIDIDAGILLPDGTFEYVDIYTGHVVNHDFQFGTITLDLESPFSMVQQAEVPEEVVIDPSSNTPAGVARDLIADTTILEADDHFDSTWNAAVATYQNIDWVISGRIRQGSQVAGAAEALARSGMATIVPSESGLLRFLIEFPEQFGHGVDHPGEVIDETVAGNWRLREGVSVTATSVSVAYNSVYIKHPDTADADEATVGSIHRTIPMQFLHLGRCAKLAAYLLYEQNRHFPLTISWTMGPLGWLYQIGDYVKVHDPITDTERQVRIVAKDWSLAVTRFEGVVQSHLDDVVRGSFGTWESTTWGSTADLLL